jgi:DNA-binding LacI/PurR family transcriptional regulator
MDDKGSKGHVTLADVARAAGVAKSTASHVFAGSSKVTVATAQKVREAAAELGYAGPSAMGRAFARGSSHVVAVMTAALLEDQDTDPFALEIIDGLQREFAHLGYAVVLLPPITDESMHSLADYVVFDAVVTVRRTDGVDETDEYLRNRGVPWLSLDAYNNEHLAVTSDDAVAVKEVIDHMRGLGHEKIAVVTLLHDPSRPHYEFVEFDEIYEASHLNIRRRLDGITLAGLTPHAILKIGMVDSDNGYVAGKALLDLDDPPTAVVCFADVHAAGIVRAAHERGMKVPDDLSVSGFDGLPLYRFADLKLTTVIQSGVAKGRASARYVAKVLAGEEPTPEKLTLEFRVGNSTGPAPKR